jgi:catechol 2,3-dioxygenase-like lactoylglutathione lyase family enzyme
MRVRPVRFTDDVAAMRRFLEALGLQPRIAADGGGWVDFTSKESGGAALHEAASATSGYPAGETSLAFESAELEAVRDRLHAAGFADANIVDEAYGRTLFVTDPDGVRVAVDEVQEDLYGYHDASSS